MEVIGDNIYPKRSGANRCQVPEIVSQILEVENVQEGRQHHLSHQEGLWNKLQLVGIEFHKWGNQILQMLCRAVCIYEH